MRGNFFRREGANTLSTRKKKKRAIALDVRGIGVPVEVRRHAGARRLTLRVSKTRRAVVVTVPDHCRMDEAGRFLNSHLDWVRERLGRVPAPVPFEDGEEIPFRGHTHRICFTGPGRGRAVVRVVRPSASGDELHRLEVSGAPEHASRRLRDWLMAQAHADLDARVSFHARSLGVRARRITLRDQTTRWGSCSANGLLSFSWRLVLAPAFVLDYVAAHEVAHLREMNHGPRFWRLVEQSVPLLEDAKTWLRQEGTELHRYGGDA